MSPDRLTLLALVLLGVALFTMVPTLAACAIRHPDRRRIARLNPLALLSFLLWGALLVWAIGGKRDDSVIARFVNTQGSRLGWVVAALVVGGVVLSGYALAQRAPTAEAGSSANTPSTPALK